MVLLALMLSLVPPSGAERVEPRVPGTRMYFTDDGFSTDRPTSAPAETRSIPLRQLVPTPSSLPSSWGWRGNVWVYILTWNQSFVPASGPIVGNPVLTVFLGVEGVGAKVQAVGGDVQIGDDWSGGMQWVTGQWFAGDTDTLSIGQMKQYAVPMQGLADDEPVPLEAGASLNVTIFVWVEHTHAPAPKLFLGFGSRDAPSGVWLPGIGSAQDREFHHKLHLREGLVFSDEGPTTLAERTVTCRSCTVTSYADIPFGTYRVPADMTILSGAALSFWWRPCGAVPGCVDHVYWLSTFFGPESVLAHVKVNGVGQGGRSGEQGGGSFDHYDRTVMGHTVGLSLDGLHLQAGDVLALELRVKAQAFDPVDNVQSLRHIQFVYDHLFKDATLEFGARLDGPAPRHPKLRALDFPQRPLPRPGGSWPEMVESFFGEDLPQYLPLAAIPLVVGGARLSRRWL